jgi:hypothetical protein
MKFAHRDLRAAPEETANVVLMVLLEARANHAVIARPVIARLETAKGVLRAGVNQTVVVNLDAAKDLRADHTVDRWAHRIQNALWKMRCVLMPTRMES